jgi:hypothetical protein
MPLNLLVDMAVFIPFKLLFGVDGAGRSGSVALAGGQAEGGEKD